MSITSASISVAVVGLVALQHMVYVASRHPDCDHLKVIKNFERMCVNYANYKRSIHEYLPGDFGNDLGQWPAASSGNGKMRPFHPQWWWYLQTVPQPQAPAQTDDKQFASDNIGTGIGAIPEDLDPINFEGEEVLAILERWRRNKEIEVVFEEFVRYQCCSKGCPFPRAYLEVDKKTNFCNLQY